MTLDLKLGRKPFVEDQRDLLAVNYLGQLPQAPTQFDVVPKVDKWPVFLNQELGDCTIAGVAHMVQVWIEAVKGKTLKIANDVVLKFYEQVSGYVPGDESTDNGANMRDVLKRWQKQEFDGHAITAFARVTQPALLNQTLWAFGGVYLGLNLPLSAQKQFADGQPWDVVDGPDSEPGSWGGHCVCGVSYDENGITVVTWGKRQYLTNQFILKYCDEAYGIISPDWLGSGKTPEGFNLSQLESDLAALRG